MHLLFVTSLLPEPEPATGFEIANGAILDAYRAAGVRLTLAGFRRPGGQPPRPNEILLGEMAIENAAVGRAQKVRWATKAVVSGLPVSAAKLRVLSERSLREKLAAAGPFDGLVLNSIQMPAAYPFLLDLAPAIFVAHNVEHLSARQNALAAGGVLQRRLYEREARLLERLERKVCECAVAVHTLAGEDAGPLGLAASEKLVTMPLTVGRPARSDDGIRDHDVGLIGTWSWAPNRVGLDWFVREVAPRLPAAMTVAIAGKFDGDPPRAPSNVTFLGRVRDAQGFVAGSRVVALATKGGTGVQLKTLETLEEGMPAVATSAALRGIDGAPPPNLRVADDPAAFADALAESVAAERSGEIGRMDGRAFAAARRDRARQAAQQALARLAACGQSARPVRRIGAVDVLALDREAALGQLAAAVDGQDITRLAFANAHCINLSRRDAAYREALRDFAVLPDGVGLDIASRLLYGRAFPANLNGTDFVPELLARLDGCRRVALLGAGEGVAEGAAQHLAQSVGRHAYIPVSHGFFRPGEATETVLAELKMARADVVLVALGVPAQELFIARYLTAEHAHLAIGVGALFDFLAGRVPRAPSPIRRMRLEWVWRLAHEPRRMAGRYLVGNPVFLAQTLRQRFERS